MTFSREEQTFSSSTEIHLILFSIYQSKNNNFIPHTNVLVWGFINSGFFYYERVQYEKGG